jgi:hypothetical protein
MDKKTDSPHEGEKRRKKPNPTQETFDENTIEDIIDRLKGACGTTSDEGLARALGIKGQSIGGARKRKKIPLGWLIDIASVYTVSLDWLFYNKKPIRPITTFPIKNSVNDIIDRLKQACDANSDKELSKALGIKRQAIGNARKREELPYVWVFAISKKFDVSLDWLFYGSKPTPGQADTISSIEDEEYQRSVKRLNHHLGIKDDPSIKTGADHQKSIENRNQQSKMVESRANNDMPSKDIVDVDLMTAVISEFEQYIFKNNLVFGPHRKAKIISGLYEHFYLTGRGFDFVAFKRFMSLIE